MTSPSYSEQGRLAALDRYRIMDTPPEACFDRITRLAARLFDVPYARISLVDATRQWCKSCYGLDLQEVRREFSFCHHALQNDGVTIVENAAADPRFQDNPFVVQEPRFRFYAGAPLVTPEGHVLGTLCILDTAPRSLSEDEVLQLEDLAAMVLEELERRRRESRSTAEEGQDRWRTMIEHHPEAVIILSEDGIIQYSNASGARIFGTASGDDLVGQSILDYMVSGQGRDLKSRLALAAEGEPLPRREYVIRRTDGNRRHIEVHSTTTRYRDRRALQSVIRDITDRRQMEQALRASEGRYRKLLDRANDAIFISDAETGMLVEANRKAQEMVGRSLQEIRQMHQVDLYPPEERDKYFRLFEAGVFEDSALGNNRYVVGAEGERIPVEIRASVIEVNDKRLVQSIFRDLRHRRQQERALRRIRKAVESASDAIGIADAQGRYIYHNHAAQELLGYTPSEINEAGGPAALFTDPQAGQHMFDALRQGRSWNREATLKCRDGRSVPVSVRADVIKDREEQTVGFITVFTDITERKRHEAELMAAKERAEEISRLKSAFLANMNHEVRTPLTSILGYSELLADEVPSEMVEHVQSIRVSGQRLLDTLSSVLNLAQLDNHRFTLNPKEVNLTKQVREVVSLFRPRAKELDLDLTCRVPEDGPVSAMLDRVALGHVLRSLISNTLTHPAEASVSVELKTSARAISIAVGCIQAARVDEFRTYLSDDLLDETNKLPQDEKTLGIGLSITKRLVELMGGRLEITSDGMFTVTFTPNL